MAFDPYGAPPLPEMIHIAPPPALCCACGHIAGAEGVDLILGHLVCRPCGDAIWADARTAALDRRGLIAADMIVRAKIQHPLNQPILRVGPPEGPGMGGIR